MLSPLLLLKLPDIAWKADACLAGDGDPSEDDDDRDGEGSFSDNGKLGSEVEFKLRFANLDDGGMGSLGIGRMRFGELFPRLIPGPSERLSIELSPESSRAAGKADMGYRSGLFCRCGGCTGG